MLCSVPSFFDSTGGAIGAYLDGCNEGKKAAFMTDNEVRTFFSASGRRTLMLLSLENKSFGGLMTWWYDYYLVINLFAEDIGTSEN